MQLQIINKKFIILTLEAALFQLIYQQEHIREIQNGQMGFINLLSFKIRSNLQLTVLLLIMNQIWFISKGTKVIYMA